MIYVLYRPNSEHERTTLEYVERLKKQGISEESIELIDMQTRIGVAKAELYDIVRFPGMVAVRGDGSLLKSWQSNLPLLDEVEYYTRQ